LADPAIGDFTPPAAFEIPTTSLVTDEYRESAPRYAGGAEASTVFAADGGEFQPCVYSPIGVG
jgi:hypothetical protein